jgi:hypothetical protein
MAGLRFDLNGLKPDAVPNEETGLLRPAPVGFNIIKNLPWSQVPDKLNFGEMGGTRVDLRSSFVRLAFMKLLASGILVAFVSVHSTNSKVAFSCALSAAVNFVACAHYFMIWRIRSQAMSYPYLHWASGRDDSGQWVGRRAEDSETEEVKIFVQETMVDGLRCAAWN